MPVIVWLSSAIFGQKTKYTFIARLSPFLRTKIAVGECKVAHYNYFVAIGSQILVLSGKIINPKHKKDITCFAFCNRPHSSPN
ncbi:hypothetical protein FDK94_06435 [Salmonella enterica]|nr:hypothetical protein [Salmonella enterica]